MADLFKLKMLQFSCRKYAAAVIYLKITFLYNKDYQRKPEILNWICTQYQKDPFFTKFISYSRLRYPVEDRDYVQAFAVLLHLVQHGEVNATINFLDVVLQCREQEIVAMIKNREKEKRDYEGLNNPKG